MKILNGKNYQVSHTRKGNFSAIVVDRGDEWTKLQITGGQANAMMRYNIGYPGDIITVRNSFLTFEDEKPQDA